MEGKRNCSCCGDVKLIFACSGASDVGEMTDRAARRLSKEGAGKMFCLAGIGGQVSGIVETTKAAARVLVIDGCPTQCAKNTLERAGFTKFVHLALSDIGMAKGKSPVTDDKVSLVVAKAKALLQ